MSCSFTLNHYREILESALKAGYEFKGFHQPVSSEKRVVYLRHDLDICLEEALEMAALEAKLGIKATYFVLVNSPLYNLFAEDSLELLNELVHQGHWIGLHVDPTMFPSNEINKMESCISKLIGFHAAVIPLVPAVSFHRPSPNVLGCDFNAFSSTYSPRFFKRVKYISDSRGVWREGCPCQALRKRQYLSLQMLVHPIWWNSTELEITNKLHHLLDKRLEVFKQYLGTNIEPIGRLLERGVQNETGDHSACDGWRGTRYCRNTVRNTKQP